MKHKSILVLIICVGIAALGVGSLAGFGYVSYRNRNSIAGNEENTGDIEQTPPESANPSNSEEQNEALSEVTIRDVSSVVANAMPFIVSIESEMVYVSRDFFGRENEYSMLGSGSGIIIGQNQKELLLVTNEHVVSNAKTVKVTLADGTFYTAEMKGSDVNSDLAVLSISISELSKSTRAAIRIATLGSSKQLKVGEMTIAIGNALGYGQSTTVGYISATERAVSLNDIERTLIQTDAAINPGNSGGALLNVNGEVIGINSVKYSSQEVEGIGYAIPISDAIPIINELMNREVLSEREAGDLGIKGKTVTASYSSRFGIPVGVYINEVKPGSPAQEAGLKEGDIIVKINGRGVSTEEDLKAILDSTRAGTTITVTVSTVSGREYVEVDYQVTLSKR